MVIVNLIQPTLKYLKSKANQSWQQVLHYFFFVVTVKKELRCMVALLIETKQRLYLMLQLIWLGSVRHFQKELKFLSRKRNWFTRLVRGLILERVPLIDGLLFNLKHIIILREYSLNTLTIHLKYTII